MPRLIFTNPFAKHDSSEYPDVVIPLSEAIHRVSSTTSREKTDDSSRDSNDGGVQTRKGMTIDDIREEIDLDPAAGGHDTAYDRELLSELS